jgi:hypothetical protein
MLKNKSYLYIMRLTGLQDILNIPKVNLLNIIKLNVVNCYKCLSIKRLICICENNNLYFDFICENLFNCEKITLNSISITDIPNNIHKITKLKKIVLANDKITNISPILSSLIFLTSLNLGNNFIEKIPSFIYNLTNLTTLNLFQNKIKYLDPKIGDLIKLKKLIMNDNLITVFPNTIANLQNLSKLYIDTYDNIFTHNDKMLIRLWHSEIVVSEGVIFLNILTANKKSNLNNLPYYLEFLKLGIITPKITNFPICLKELKISNIYKEKYDDIKIPFGCNLIFY